MTVFANWSSGEWGVLLNIVTIALLGVGLLMGRQVLKLLDRNYKTYQEVWKRHDEFLTIMKGWTKISSDVRSDAREKLGQLQDAAGEIKQVAQDIKEQAKSPPVAGTETVEVHSAEPPSQIP